MNHAADGLKHTLKRALFAFSSDPNSTEPRRADLMDFSPLGILTMSQGSSIWREMGEITHYKLIIYILIHACTFDI